MDLYTQYELCPVTCCLSVHLMFICFIYLLSIIYICYLSAVIYLSFMPVVCLLIPATYLSSICLPPAITRGPTLSQAPVRVSKSSYRGLGQVLLRQGG